MKWCRIAPNGLIWSINFQNFSWRACSQTPQKGLPPSAVIIILFNHFRSWFLIFSLFKWSVPALWCRPFTCKLCVCVFFFWTVDILHLYIVKECFSFFLMNIFHSPLIGYEIGGGGGGGGEGDPWYHSDFFFITIQICLSWRVAGLLIFVSPKPLHDGRGQVTLGYLLTLAWMLMVITPNLGFLKLHSSGFMRLVLSTSCASRHLLYPQCHIFHQRNTQMLPVNHQGEVLVKGGCS